MKHFNFLSKDTENKLFYKIPIDFSLRDNKEIISMGLGATMYSPGTNLKIAEKIKNKDFKGLTSLVLCLEDSIDIADVEIAEKNIIKQLYLIEKDIEDNKTRKEDVPIIFIRIRNVKQFLSFSKKYLTDLSAVNYLAGFSLPKFDSSNANEMLKIIDILNDIRIASNKSKFYAMPILESEAIIYKEMRINELEKIKDIITKHRDIVLNIRIGGTDFSSYFGIRRGVDFSIYDIGVVNDCITDINNILGRSCLNLNISGVVWEYFSNHGRMLKPQLRETPFRTEGFDGQEKRRNIISNELDGLIKEVIIDKANGFIGKTVIHPSHIKIVNAIHVVTYEEYHDALSIINSSGGVLKGINGNKMNETKPHLNWAKKTIAKSKVYGVLNENGKYVDLF